MPKVRRRLPEARLRHLLLRAEEREIHKSQFGLLARWLDTDPDVPDGRWFTRFPEMIVCGEGEWVQTFLRPGHLAEGEEVA